MSDLEIASTSAAEPTPSATPAAATPAPAPAQATPSANAPAATGQVPEGYVPSYRVRETREAALREAQTRYEAQASEQQEKFNRLQSQLHALVGVTPPADPQQAAVRDQFGNLYPGLSKLEERANDLLGLIERAGDLESQTNHYWQSYGRQTMDRLFDHMSTSLGAPLTDEGKRALHSAFTGFVQSSPELTARYASDPTIVDDFVRGFTSNFIDPARRGAAAQVAGRAPGNIPQDTPGGIPRTSPVPAPANLDERVATAWTQYQQSKK